LAWCKATKAPFGFSKYEDEWDSDLREGVISDVRREVGMLLIVANERSFGKDDRVVPPPPTPRELAVLKVIPLWPNGMTGKEILRKLVQLKDPETEHLIQSALTKDIIPKLKKYYGVENEAGVGYYLIPQADTAKYFELISNSGSKP
jgi:hypothetical protein